MKNQVKQVLKVEDEEIFYVVDISSFIFRAYHSMGYLSTSAKIPVGAVLGIANMMISLLDELNPSYLAIAMDSKTPTFRKEIFSEYKANRPPPPDDLVVQFPLIEELIDAFNYKSFRQNGFEADDLIATLVKKALLENKKVVIVSGDKDLLQLVSQDVVMLDTMKKKVWDTKAVEEKWSVPPSLIRDLFALIGDSSDNIPGVPRVGQKTAAPLILKAGNLDNLLEKAEKYATGTVAARLKEHSALALLSRNLVTLKEDVPMDFSLESTLVKKPCAEKLLPLLEKLEFRQLKEKLLSSVFSDEPVAQQKEPIYETVESFLQLDSIIAKIKENKKFCIDLETTSLNTISAQIVGIALCYEEYLGYYIPVAHNKGNCLQREQVLEKIKPILEDEQMGIIIQNLKYEDSILRRHNIHMKNIIMDPMLASYLLRAEQRSHGLDNLAMEILGRKMRSYNEVTNKTKGTQMVFDEVDIENATVYAAEDAEVTFCLANSFSKQIKENKMDELLTNLEIPLARILCEMELWGIQIDVDRLGQMSKVFGQSIIELEERAFELAGKKFNLSSPLQLREILFDQLGLPPQKKTKTGYSTDYEVLESLALLHELPQLLLEHRNLSKLKSGYTDALPKLVNPQTQRIHTSFNQTVAATGRLSSSNPNLQNIPIKTQRGRDIRKAFIASPGHVLLCADYSQVELRILAHLSKDAQLIEAYNNNRDIHSETAKAVFSLSEDQEVSREQRSMAKVVNFGVIYGKTSFSLAKELNIPRSQAQQFIDAYFDKYKGVAKYMDKTIEETKEKQAAYTLLGRKRDFPQINSSNFNIRSHAERMARNMPVQGSAADLIKLAMIKVDKELKNNNFKTRMLLTVHDELVFEVPEDELESVKKLVKYKMETAMSLEVPLLVEMGVGKNWDEAH